MQQSMVLELPDDIYEALTKAASERGVQPMEWVVGSLRHLLFDPRPGSPQAILQVVNAPPHLDPEDVREMERLIEEGAMPIDWEPLFEDEDDDDDDAENPS